MYAISCYYNSNGRHYEDYSGNIFTKKCFSKQYYS